MPATEYELKITAHNNAGDTVAIYNFTTYTLTGSKSYIEFLGFLYFYFAGIPILIPPDQHSGGSGFFENVRTAVLIIASLLLPTFVIAGLFWRKSIRFNGNGWCNIITFSNCARDETRTGASHSLHRGVPDDGTNSK